MIQTTNLPMPGFSPLQPQIYIDECSYFVEVNRSSELEQCLGDIEFVPESQRGCYPHVLRVLRYQLKKFQAKLTDILTGRIFDLVIDFRLPSAGFGRCLGLEFCGEKKLQLLITAGFSHGFLTLCDYAEVAYKTDQSFVKADFSIKMGSDQSKC